MQFFLVEVLVVAIEVFGITRVVFIFNFGNLAIIISVIRYYFAQLHEINWRQLGSGRISCVLQQWPLIRREKITMRIGRSPINTLWMVGFLVDEIMEP
jgi:hypothetical protein